MTIKKIIVLDIDADKADEALNKVAEALGDVADNVEEVGEEAAKTIDSTKKMEKGFKGVGKAVKGVGTAMKAAGIGLIIALFAKLAEIAGKNQKVLDLFSNAMTSLEIAFKDFYNFVTSNFMPAVERVKTFFENLTFDKIKKAIKEGITQRFQQLMEVIGLVGKALKKVFEGDFKGAMDASREAAKQMVDVVTGVDNTVDKVKETVTKAATAIKEYAVETYSAAKAMTQLNNQALIAESINKGLIEQYDRQAEQLRQIRDDDLRLIEDRIEANERLGAVLNEQEQLMLRNADLAIQAAQNQLALNNNVENQIALQDALNEKAGIQAQIEGFRSEQLVNQNALLRERAEVEQEYYDEIDEMMAADLEESEKNLQKREEDDNKAAEDRIKLEERVEGAKLDLANTTSNLIRMIAGEDSKVAKGVAVGQATINAYQGITSTLAAPSVLPEPFGTAQKIVSAGIIGAMAFKNVKSILATDPAKGGGGGGGSSMRGAAPSAPSFNLVQGTGTNQIAEGLNQQEPIAKAYVVSSDVSTSQELDRKIVEGASL